MRYYRLKYLKVHSLYLRIMRLAVNITFIVVRGLWCSAMSKVVHDVHHHPWLIDDLLNLSKVAAIVLNHWLTSLSYHISSAMSV